MFLFLLLRASFPTTRLLRCGEWDLVQECEEDEEQEQEQQKEQEEQEKQEEQEEEH